MGTEIQVPILWPLVGFLGFLYTGTIYHEQLYLSQYIAPLMADFNPSLSDLGRILVYSTEERFAVQWDQVLNRDHEEWGPFTFQASIFPSGKIHLVYWELPLLWTRLNNNDFPVEIGISDAFYYETPGFVLLVEYSRVSATDLLEEEETDLSYSAFEFDPVPNCVIADTCDSCMAITEQGIFNCLWCEAAEQKCSDGIDRFTKEWSDSSCFTDAISVCPLPPISPSTSAVSTTVVPTGLNVSESSILSPSSIMGIVVGGASLVVLATFVVLGGCLLFYGFQHPTSTVGMFMIENRPKAWALNQTPTNREMKSKT